MYLGRATARTDTTSHMLLVCSLKICCQIALLRVIASDEKYIFFVHKHIPIHYKMLI